jgi:hypothetical protein
MQLSGCARSGREGTVYLASVGAWTCAACATTISQARRRARRQRPGRIGLEIPPPAMHRTEHQAIQHLRLI